MPISNTISIHPISSIILRPDDRQRTTLDPQKFLELTSAILTNHWISPILVRKEDGMLMAGGRRYSVVSALAAATRNDWSLFPEACREAARSLPITCPVESWANWTKIPCQFGTKLTDLDLHVFEWAENWNREDLSWQDKAQAIYKISGLLYKSDPEWTDVKTAARLAISPSQLSDFLTPYRVLASAPEQLRPELSRLISESTSPISAKNAIGAKMERHGVQVQRRQGSGMIGLAAFAAADKAEMPQPPTIKEPQPTTKPITLGEQLILCTNFHDWAANYEGEKFNFLHCDFPYGISYNEGGNFGSNPATIAIGNYDDSEEVYWELIETIIANRNRLLDSQAHIMFWFSQNMEAKTRQMFADAWPDAIIHSHKMIWVHPAKQTTPDPYRYGQRNYETAMCISLGDRKVVRPIRLATVYDHETPKVHRSEKPIPVLSHFFSMFIDGSSKVLDPTCGSATSIITAHRLGAAKVLGLEMDSEMHKQAVDYFNREIKQ